MQLLLISTVAYKKWRHCVVWWWREIIAEGCRSIKEIEKCFSCCWSCLRVVHTLFKCFPAVSGLFISDAHDIVGHPLKSEFSMLPDIACCLNCFILLYLSLLFDSCVAHKVSNSCDVIACMLAEFQAGTTQVWVSWPSICVIHFNKSHLQSTQWKAVSVLCFGHFHRTSNQSSNYCS